MATLTFLNQVFYKGGKSGVSAVVGYESNSTRVVRYSFQAPPKGANKISVLFNECYSGHSVANLRFFIGTDPESHADAGADYPFTGELTAIFSKDVYSYSGEADIILLPNQTYYLWVFPSTKTLAWMYWSVSLRHVSGETFGGAYSTLSPQSGMLGETQSLMVTQYNQNYTHTIKYTLGSISGTICEKSSDINIPWQTMIDWAWQITDSDRGDALLSISSYLNDELIGTDSDVPFTLIVPENIVPSVEMSVSDLSKAFEMFGVIVQGESMIRVDIEGEGVMGSTIKEKTFSFAGRNYQSGSIVTSVPESGDFPLVASVVDSRGRVAFKEITLHVYEYERPLITVSASRCDEDGNADDTGEFAFLTFKTTSSDVAGRNNARILFSYGDSSEEFAVSTGEITSSKIVRADSTKTLYISAHIVDSLYSSETSTMTLSIGYATMDFLSGGKGIAFGTTATVEGFECAMDTKFTGAVSVPTPTESNHVATKDYVDQMAGQTVAPVDFIVETGSEGIWSWRKWNSGYIELDGKKDYWSTTYLNQSGSIYYAYLGEVKYPFELTEITTISFGFIATTGNAWHWGQGVSTTGITNSYIGRGNSTSVAGYPTFHITGKWK